MQFMEHFGVKLINRGKSFKLNREEFALISTKPSLPYFSSLAEKNAYCDENGSAYREEWCNEYRELCLKNYDLNMKFFSMLDRAEFDEVLQSFLKQNKSFTEINNLNECDSIEGYYVMVLDKYKQVYIGKTEDIKRRIMQHWSKTKQFDRTLLPMYAYEKSCFSIDFFRALDTTRIYVWKRKLLYGLEDKLISEFPNRFCTNRIGGDVTNGIQALATMNRRNFSKD